MDKTKFNNGLMAFIKESPTPFHAVETMAAILERAGFTKLHEERAWSLEEEGKYYVVRNGSSLIALTTGNGKFQEEGFRMAGAHTDSPGLKIKPSPGLVRNACLQLGVEVYGSPLLNTWFDRDLSIAGRVSYIPENGETVEVKNQLVDFKRPVATIPSLAIHLDREANSKRSVNNQKDLPPVFMQLAADEKADFKKILQQEVFPQGDETGAGSEIDHELYLYDVQPPSYAGFKDDFITCARIDNLFSCYTAIAGLVESGGHHPALIVLNDHEESGSLSTTGASGTFLKSVLARIAPHPEVYARMVDRSIMISADNAHGIHPNHGEKHDENHPPLLNGGPVIKINANQRYATSSHTGALFRYLGKKAGVPVQDFVMRSDMPCGSTIGPITAGEIGIKTVDVGLPMLAMHSIREMAGSSDAWYLYRVFREYFGTSRLLF